MRRLQKNGYLNVYDKECAGRNRRYYRLTDEGSAQLTVYRKEWREYVSKISGIFEGGEDNE